MSDIIHILPDAVANQIAAGEVIQRPASAVKELMENSIDAGADHITLIIKDAGKSLIQVIDNGCGMSETDARMSFERHATSKIQSASDLFSIRTMGFRGEALASVAAIAQLEMKTKRREDETGTIIRIEGAEVKYHQPGACPDGTSISVSNLFFNVPARRNFLKSNAAETRHIIEEFQRMALAHPGKSFAMHHNGMEVFNLRKENLRQRITSLFGANINENLVPVGEETSLIRIEGFAGKPECAKKTRGEQYFFVNKRFIKDPYLNHAVVNAFEQLLPRDSFPSYFLNITIDPSKIDVNIHPTKTEIKFEDDKAIYAILRAAVKRSLGKFSIMPSLDFERETSFDVPLKHGGDLTPPGITINPEYNPFEVHAEKSKEKFDPVPLRSFTHAGRVKQEDWVRFYSGTETETELITQSEIQTQAPQDFSFTESDLHQLRLRYIVVSHEDGVLIIDQQAAHERILYEQFLDSMNKKPAASQQDLFPKTISFNAADAEIVKELEDKIRMIGFDISEFGKNTYVIHGAPAGLEPGMEIKVIENVIEDFKHNASGFRDNPAHHIARTLSLSLSVKRGKMLSSKEMHSIVTGILNCSNSQFSFSGKPVLYMMRTKDIDVLFNRKA